MLRESLLFAMSDSNNIVYRQSYAIAGTSTSRTHHNVIDLAAIPTLLPEIGTERPLHKATQGSLSLLRSECSHISGPTLTPPWIPILRQQSLPSQACSCRALFHVTDEASLDSDTPLNC